MADWSPVIANEFIRRAAVQGRTLTQMQLQKLVYIAHGWHLAIAGERLTYDDPQAWDYGPVYRELWQALREYGRSPVAREIRQCDYMPGRFDTEHLEDTARANLTESERSVIDRVYRDYGQFHAFQLSALTHKDGTPWTQVYAAGTGKFDDIRPDLIREHFVGIATQQPA